MNEIKVPAFLIEVDELHFDHRIFFERADAQRVINEEPFYRHETPKLIEVTVSFPLETPGKVIPLKRLG